MGVRMIFGIAMLRDYAVDRPVGLALALEQFVADDLALAINLGLVESGRAHPRRFDRERLIELAPGHRREIGRVVFARNRVDRGRAEFLEMAKRVAGELSRARIHHMLEEMRETALALR